MVNGPSTPAWRASVDLLDPLGPALSINRGTADQAGSRRTDGSPRRTSLWLLASNATSAAGHPETP